MRWEYSIVSVGASTQSTLKALLAEHGEKGWELAAITDLGGEKLAIFKRSVERLAHDGA
jgi:hypothetical protein